MILVEVSSLPNLQVLIDQAAFAQSQDQVTAAQQSSHGQHETAAQVCVQATAVLRNLAVSPSHATLFVQQQGLPLQALLQLLAVFHHQQEVVLNVSRSLSKLSLDASCREVMVHLELQQHSGQQRGRICSSSQGVEFAAAVPCLVQLLLQPQAQHNSQWPLVLRVAFVLGNLTTYHPEARTAIAAVSGALDGVLQLALELLHPQDCCSEQQPKQQQQHGQQAALTTTSTSCGKASAEDVLVKLLRLLGNIAIDQEAGAALAANAAMAELVLGVLHAYDFDRQEELVLNAVAALTNLVFYNSPESEVSE